MTEDRYALELERAIFNWYYGDDNAAPEAVFNAVANGLNNDCLLYTSDAADE